MNTASLFKPHSAGRLILAVSIILAAAPSAQAALIFPPAGHLAKEAKITLLYYVDDKDPKSVSCKPEKGDAVEHPLTRGFGRTECDLAPGKNVIRWGDDAREVFYATGDIQPPEGFELHYLHEAVEDCDNCHTEGGKGRGMKGGMPEICFECHEDPTKDDKGAKSSVHSPVADGECLSCHQQHYSLKPKLIDQAVPTLCLECHDKVSADKDGKDFAGQHEPVSSGECLECHRVHASDYPSLADAEGEKLCVKCHDDPSLDDKGEKKKALHEPVSSGECSSCHKVHGSAQEGLLTSPPEDLCKECHEYPVTAEDGEKFKYLHEPVDGAECLSCHDAHASAFDGLVKKGEPELCLECHDDPKLGPDGKSQALVHSPVEDGCLECHLPHGSMAPKLLTAPGADLCLKCHDDVRLDANGVTLSFLHTPVQEGKCTACHQAHAAPLPKLVTAKGNAFCLSCHKEFHPEHRTADTRDLELRTSVPDDFPAEKMGTVLSCSGCHRVHGSAYEVLFPVERIQLCAKCHIF